jgi:signal transduction histidine kinase
MTIWRGGRRTASWWVALALAVGLLAADLYGHVERGATGGSTVLFFVAMTAGLAAGLWIWAWRPQTRMGPLMFWWPALTLAADLGIAYPTSRTATTVGLALYTVGPIVYAHMTLAYPNGRLEGRLSYIYIYGLAYAAQAMQNLGNLLFYDGRGCPFCIPQERSYVYVGPAPFSLDWWNRGWAIEIIAILPIGLALVLRKLLRAGPGVRRTYGPLAASLTVGTVCSWVILFLIVIGDQAALESVSSLVWVINVGFLGGAVFSFVGLALTRRARGAVGDLVVELDRAGPGGVREALARAIGDPGLELALWLPERGVWVDEAGREVMVPSGHDRAVTYIGHELAALVHDPAFLDQPAMLEAAGSAARLALENERLQAELRSQLAELRESRARIVRAGDEERRRLERDLHDGAQQRLLAIGMALQLLRSALDENEVAKALLNETEAEMTAALHELRELARGLHPAVLTDQGLAPALRTLTERAPIPVELDAIAERLPPPVETAVYFIVAEALANIAKHAVASRGSVTVERRNGVVRIEVVDDGVGGAALDSPGSGLRGLADRTSALDGRLRIESERGRGTRLVAEIPCGS